MNLEYVFLKPLDVLYLRGNRVFGDAGDHGEAIVPPWPSLAAGALRSRILMDHQLPPAALQNGGFDEPWRTILGTLEQPGSFRVSSFHLARKTQGDRPEALHPCPADLFISESNEGAYLRPITPAPALSSSYGLPLIPSLPKISPGKPKPGWLNARAWAAYLAGTPISSKDLIEQHELWKIDTRIGIGLDRSTRAAERGKIVSSDTIAFAEHVGLLVGVSGAGGKVPTGGLLRLGGDGRGAAISKVASPDTCDYQALTKSGRLRLVLTSPGIFCGGWKLPEPLERCVAAAAVPRHGVISGWDLARWKPKPALRTVPAGAVYWLEGVTLTASELEQIEVEGLWDEPISQDLKSRRAEGFNAVTFAAWPQDQNAS